MKKITIPVIALLVALLLCLTGCNTNFKFEDLALSKDDISQITVFYANGKKEVSNTSKIEKVITELNALDIEKYSEKIADNVFNDSVVGSITMQMKDKEGSFTMVFVEITAVDGEKISLVKCDTTDGLKIKNLKKGIYTMQSVVDTNALLNKIFANCI